MDNQKLFEYKKNNLILVKQKFVRGTIHRFSWHNTIELLVVLYGEMEVFANGVAYLLKENDLLVLGANCGHAFYPKTNNSVIFTTEVAPAFLEEQGLPVFKYGAISSNELPEASLLWITVRQQLAKIHSYIKDLGSSECYADIGLRASVTTLFADIYRECAARMGEQLLPAESMKRNEAVQEAITYIHSNYRDKVTLDSIAELTGYNKTYLTSLFKKQVGIGVYEYLIRTRIQHSMVQLGEAEKSITDIALDCGFADSHSFATYTRKYCGRSPQEYQKLFAGGGQREPLDDSDALILKKMSEYLSLRDDSRLQEALGAIRKLTDAYLGE